MSDSTSGLRSRRIPPLAIACATTVLAALLLGAAFTRLHRPDVGKEVRDVAARIEATAQAATTADAQSRRLRADQADAAAKSAYLAKARGTLSVQTQPEGADVFSGARYLGETPFSLPGQRLGKYPVRIRRNGYSEINAFIEVKEGSGPPEAIPLVRLTGTLKFETMPAGLPLKIRCDRSDDSNEEWTPFEGKSPVELTLPTGNYVVEVQRESYEDHQTELGIEPGETVSKSVSMTPGRLELTSIPSGAEVFHEGEKVGTTPYVLDDVRSSFRWRHYVLQLKGYESSGVTVSVDLGEVIKESVELLKDTPSEDGQ